MSYLEIRGVRRLFGGVAGIRDFDFAAEPGEFVSLLGPSGCGKTTALRAVAGFEHPDQGTILVDGRDITRLPVAARKIGMVFQNYALFPNMTVADNIGFGLRIAGRPAAAIRARVGEMLELIRLPAIGDRYPWQLSGGQQQRVALARALAVEPTLLLLDEPLSALDAKVRVAVRDEIRSVQRRLGITTLFVTHDQGEALAVSDRVVVMNEGRIEQIGTPADIYNAPATRFVASFVGTLNLLACPVVDAASNRVSIGGHPVAVGGTVPPGLAPGETCTVALRPEAATIDGPAGDSRLTLPAKVENVEFLGALVRIRVALDGHSVVVDTFNNPGRRLPTIGQPVSLAFVPGDLRALAE